MESLKLNNAPASLFVGSRTDERKEIVAGSRLLLAESHGKLFANARKEKFEARMNEAEYRKMNESVSQKTFLFCAKVAAQATGQDAPKDYAEFLRGQKQWFRNNSFLATLQGITTEVISPMIPYTTSNALGDLAFEHFHILAPDAVESILLRRDIHLVAVGAAGTAVDKGELKGQGTVKVVEKRAPPAEDGSLILGGRHGVVDVLIFHGLGVEPAGELTHPVRVHRHIGDGLLGGHHRPALISFCVWFCFGCVQ